MYSGLIEEALLAWLTALSHYKQMTEYNIRVGILQEISKICRNSDYKAEIQMHCSFSLYVFTGFPFASLTTIGNSLGIGILNNPKDRFGYIPLYKTTEYL